MLWVPRICLCKWQVNKETVFSDWIACVWEGNRSCECLSDFPLGLGVCLRFQEYAGTAAMALKINEFSPGLDIVHVYCLFLTAYIFINFASTEPGLVNLWGDIIFFWYSLP